MNVFLVAAAGDGPPISPRVCKALLISCLGEEGQRVFSTLPPVVKEESETDFDVAIRQLNLFFEPKTNVVVERFTFRQRGQQPGETTAEYVSVLRGLAKTCNFRTMEDEMIRDIVVEKTASPSPRKVSARWYSHPGEGAVPGGGLRALDAPVIADGQA